MTDLSNPTIGAYVALGVPRGAAARLADAYPAGCDLPTSPAEVAHAAGRKGPPPAWCRRVVGAFTLCARVVMVPWRTPVRDPSQAEESIRPYIVGQPVECFAVAMLTARGRLIETRVVHRGTRAAVTVHPREVFRPAIAVGAHSIIVAHNHPSEDPTPSEADRELTARLVDAGETTGIPVLDHLVMTRTSVVSFAERGMLG